MYVEHVLMCLVCVFCVTRCVFSLYFLPGTRYQVPGTGVKICAFSPSPCQNTLSCYVTRMLKPSFVAQTDQTKQGGGAGTSGLGATAGAGSGLVSNEQGLNIQNLQSILQNMGFSPQEQVGIIVHIIRYVYTVGYPGTQSEASCYHLFEKMVETHCVGDEYTYNPNPHPKLIKAIQILILGQSDQISNKW